jgi:diacylglycerol kinase (ATP)
VLDPRSATQCQIWLTRGSILAEPANERTNAVRVLVIGNPVAGRGLPLRRLRAYLEKNRPDNMLVELAVTSSAAEARSIARRAVADPPDVLAVCGGDGSVNEVACAVQDPPFPLAVLPGGTQNLLARELGINRDPVEALRCLPRLAARRVDLGLINDGSRGVFLLMVGIGFDAWVAASVSAADKKRWGTGAYYSAVCRALTNYPVRTFSVRDPERRITCSSCVISNAAAYGGGLALNPLADMSDGVLDVLTLGIGRRVGYFRFLLAARLGLALDFKTLNRFRSALVEVEGPRGVQVQADGEVCGQLPITVSVRARAFPVLAPQRAAPS